MGKKHGKKGQAGLEYLVTYSWALAFVVALMGLFTFLMLPGEGTATCSNFDSFTVKGVRADTEKIHFVVQNITGGSINGLEVYSDLAYETPDSPPLFQINPSNATVGNTTSTSLSNDSVVDFIPGYQNPLPAANEKNVIIPWPVDGFAGEEFGPDGCLFFTNSLGKKFRVNITAYYRDQFDLLREESSTCIGSIQPAEIVDFPPESWGC